MSVVSSIPIVATATRSVLQTQFLWIFGALPIALGLTPLPQVILLSDAALAALMG